MLALSNVKAEKYEIYNIWIDPTASFCCDLTPSGLKNF